MKRYVWWFFARNAVAIPPQRTPFWMRVIPWRTRLALLTGPLAPEVEVPKEWRVATVRTGTSVMPLLVAAGAGAALALLFDPVAGARRRALVRDRVLAFGRRQFRGAERLGRVTTAGAVGAAQRAIHELPPQFLRSDDGAVDDVTLARRVESEIFRGADVDKGRINVSAENGIVLLVGEVDRPEQVTELGDAVRAVRGVRGVDNLLHVVGTPAPSKHHMAEAR